MRPQVDFSALKIILTYKPKLFFWTGADLCHVRNVNDIEQMVVIEVNSCPSGQKSMPICDANQIERGYKILIEETFSRIVQEGELSEAGLAVIYDKNLMETSGYATVMANHFKEPVYLVSY